MMFGNNTPRKGDAARSEILRFVSANPGVHKSELCRAVGLGWGTVSYHLRLLERARQLQLVLSTRETRVFPSQVPQDKLQSYAAIRAGHGEAIAKVLASRPGARQRDICDALGTSRKIIRRHLEILRKEGLVSTQGERRARYALTPQFEALLQPQAWEHSTPAPEPPQGP